MFLYWEIAFLLDQMISRFVPSTMIHFCGTRFELLLYRALAGWYVTHHELPCCWAIWAHEIRWESRRSDYLRVSGALRANPSEIFGITSSLMRLVRHLILDDVCQVSHTLFVGKVPIGMDRPCFCRSCPIGLLRAFETLPQPLLCSHSACTAMKISFLPL